MVWLDLDFLRYFPLEKKGSTTSTTTTNTCKVSQKKILLRNRVPPSFSSPLEETSGNHEPPLQFCTFIMQAR